MENEHKILTAGDLLQSFVQMKERRRESPATAPGLLCCLPSRRQEGQEEPRDRVEAASVLLQRKVRSEKKVREELQKLKDSGISDVVTNSPDENSAADVADNNNRFRFGAESGGNAAGER